MTKIALTSQTCIASPTSRKGQSHTIEKREDDNWGYPQPKKLAKRHAAPIVFSKEDDNGVQFLHDDVMVITLNIRNYDIHYILINNRSLANVLYFDELLKM